MIINKLNIVPWQEKGRWYQAFVESNGSTNTLTNCDITGCEISGNFIKLPANYIVIDEKMSIHTSGGTGTSAVSITDGIRRFADGTQGLMIPSPTAHDYTTVYFFANYEE